MQFTISLKSCFFLLFWAAEKGTNFKFQWNLTKIVRKQNTSPPFRKLLVIFDHYIVPSNDNGYFYTVNSYEKKYYEKEIPILPDGKRLSDIIDFRPRVKEFLSNIKELKWVKKCLFWKDIYTSWSHNQMPNSFFRPLYRALPAILIILKQLAR